MVFFLKFRKSHHHHNHCHYFSSYLLWYMQNKTFAYSHTVNIDYHRLLYESAEISHCMYLYISIYPFISVCPLDCGAHHSWQLTVGCQTPTMIGEWSDYLLFYQSEIVSDNKKSWHVKEWNLRSVVKIDFRVWDHKWGTVHVLKWLKQWFIITQSKLIVK